MLETSERGDGVQDGEEATSMSVSSSFNMSDSTELDMNSMTSSSCVCASSCACSLLEEERERGLAMAVLLFSLSVAGIVSVSSRDTALSSSGALMLASSLEAFTVDEEEEDGDEKGEEEGLREGRFEATSCARLIAEETRSASRSDIPLAAGRLNLRSEDSTTRLASRKLSMVVP